MSYIDFQLYLMCPWSVMLNHQHQETQKMINFTRSLTPVEALTFFSLPQALSNLTPNEGIRVKNVINYLIFLSKNYCCTQEDFRNLSCQNFPYNFSFQWPPIFQQFKIHCLGLCLCVDFLLLKHKKYFIKLYSTNFLTSLYIYLIFICLCLTI